MFFLFNSFADPIILAVYSYAFRFLYIQPALKQCRFVPKMYLNASLHCFDVIGSHMFTLLYGCNC